MVAFIVFGRPGRSGLSNLPTLPLVKALWKHLLLHDSPALRHGGRELPAGVQVGLTLALVM